MRESCCQNTFLLIETVLTVRGSRPWRGTIWAWDLILRGSMTLEELAARLNYNGPSGAQKALDGAIRKLREQFDSGAWDRWREAKRVIKCWLVK